MDVRDVVTGALRELGVLAAGEVATADDAEDGRLALNNLIDQMAAERLQIFAITRTTWTITATASYTVGVGGTINVARPVYIDHVNLIDTAPAPDNEIPLDSLTDDAYAAIPNKAMTSTLPNRWYYNPTFPLGTLYLLPIPTQSLLQGALYAAAAVSEFTSINTTFTLPPGYRMMLVKGLAVTLAPAYKVRLDGGLVAEAREAKGIVKRSNTRISDLSFDLGALIGTSGHYNIRTDR